MSEVGFLETLLDGAEVEWKTLEDISITISSGGTPKTGVAEYYDGDIPWLRTQEVDFDEIWDTGIKITESGLKNSSAKWIPKNCVIIAMYGATVGKIGINKIPMATNQACSNIQLDQRKVIYRYVFHFLAMQYEYIKSLGSGSQTNINAGIVKKLKIPVPCPDNPQKSLAIQAEIVRILDSFTALKAELEAELEARKKQYGYYRDRLLNFATTDGLGDLTTDEHGLTQIPFLEKLLDGAEVVWLPLGKIGDLVRGNGLPKRDFTETGVPAIHYGQIYTYYGLSTKSTISFVSHDTAQKLQKVNKGDVVITNTSENFEDVGTALAYLGEEQAVTGGHATIFKPSQKILGKYFAYFTQTTTFEKAKRKFAKGAKVIDVSANDMSKIEIPIPCPDNPQKSLAIQAEIVRILDSFDTLTNSISEGLPREIELRQKQYEYYRDLLLNFPKPKQAMK